MRSAIIFIFLLFYTLSFAQDSTSSSAFKANRPITRYPLIKARYPSYPLMANFFLLQKANSGDPFAQHELGLRYLLGEGFSADTSKALFWIKKAADQNITAAQFNYGIMLVNGIGVDWNPFEAYSLFKNAAESGMPQGEYVYGLMLTDNLVVNKNLTEAYKWVKKAAEGGFKPAEETLKQLREAGIGAPIDTSFSIVQNTNYDSIDALEFNSALFDPDLELDYYNFNEDSLSNDDQVIKKILNKEPAELKRILGITKIKDADKLPDTTGVALIKFAAKAGSPEALLIAGNGYENGILVKKDSIEAAVNYIRSFRVGSPRAAAFLYKMVQSEEFFKKLKKGIDNGNTDAMYVWAGLVALGFDYRLTDQQAFDLLKEAADDNHIYSIIEIGLCYYTGTLVESDKDEAIEYWEKAADLGSREATVRIALTRIKEEKNDDLSDEIELLKTASDEGSVLAQAGLAYCYERGIGVKRNKGTAATYYRIAAQRGNEAAFNSLQRMYDEMRPDKDTFKIFE